MKTINVSQAEGPALDWLVEKAKGTHWSMNGYFVFKRPTGTEYFDKRPEYRYSIDWSQGGPIIEREGIWTSTTDEGGEDPSCLWRAELPYLAVEVGPTPLIAAMRCFCCSKLGDVVDIPEELCQQQKS